MNKLLLLVKDEEGMTLVELLAVIVILSIVAGIGGVAIAGVIQRSREDGRVADVQMLYEAATLAEASDSFISKGGSGTGATPGTKVTAKTLYDSGYATSVAFLKNKAGADTSDKASFLLVGTTGANKLQLSIEKDSFLAGSKPNAEMKDMDAGKVKVLTRATVFPDTKSEPEGS
ncbi:type II secretion system protein [Lactococcus piscium]|uniref:type II secretion system protein n=1 Tax=Pseudolactococcus carnosus TaxID=2749961 RepID=UPI001FBB0A71|nr:type II secretion system protein [Lactococcus carnosus]MCJ1995999.1 type II secretion system protein [Lactococcus carnosus]